MTFTTLLFELDADGIAVATVNRPDKMNALNAAVIDDLAALAERIAMDDAIKGVVLTGAGPKAFVAGADIGELVEVDQHRGRVLAERGQRAFRALERLGKPVIAAVNGFALGGGCELAMACHFRYASPNARFGQPEVKLGLIPGYGGTVRLPRLIGRGRATELLLTGAMIDAAEAHRIGLVNRVVEAEQLVEEAKATLRLIAQMGPKAVALTLESVDLGIDDELATALAIETERFAAACGTSDKAEGTRAFLEKRSAAFTGR